METQDDLRGALEASMNAAEAPEPVVTPEPVAEVTEKPRDEAGKFVAKAEPTPIETAPESVIEAPVRKAPSSWKPEAQTAWLKADKGEALTPEETRLLALEAERREGDFHKGIGEFKTFAEQGKAFEHVTKPYQQTFQSLGVDAPTAVSYLLKADHILRTSDPATKTQYMHQLAQQYGIDLGGQPQQTDPQIQYLMNELNQVRQSQMTWQSQLQQQEQARANAQIQEFAAGKPHFEAVRDDMATLLHSGKATDMNQAYDMAVWMRPEIRQTLIEQQRAEAQRKAIEDSTNARAKAASVSVKGSSPASGGIQPAKGSLREQLESAFAQT